MGLSDDISPILFFVKSVFELPANVYGTILHKRFCKYVDRMKKNVYPIHMLSASPANPKQNNEHNQAPTSIIEMVEI